MEGGIDDPEGGVEPELGGWVEVDGGAGGVEVEPGGVEVVVGGVGGWVGEPGDVGCTGGCGVRGVLLAGPPPDNPQQAGTGKMGKFGVLPAPGTPLGGRPPKAIMVGAASSDQIGAEGRESVVAIGGCGKTGPLMTSAGGSAGDIGPAGTSATRLPQRVRARCSPSVSSVSPACSVTSFFVQKIRSPSR